MYITPLQSDKQPLQITSVKGSPEKMEAVKKLGHGMLSHAFQIGMDVVLGIGANETQQLEAELKTIDEHINALQARRDIILNKLNTVKAFEEQKQVAVERDNGEFEVAVSEYKRCAPKIVYNKQTQMSEHLAGLLNWTNLSDVRKFFANRTIEPTEEEIRAFLKRG